jgi:hypothetical protein
MRQLDQLRKFTTLPSVRKCGAVPLAGAIAVTSRADGTGGFSGLTRCGSIWGCTECQPVIRAQRAAELERLAGRWLETGHAIGMVTLTTRHWSAARLAPQIKGTAGAWRKLQAGRWWGNFRARWGVIGVTRALEMTHSWSNSWHSHLHVLFWFEADVDEATVAKIEAELYERWAHLVKKAKLGTPTRKRGVRLDMARRGKEGAGDLAKYVVKLDEAGALGNEMLRGDLKAGRHKGRTPFEILARAIAGDEAELELWAEYESATKGHRMLTWGGDIRDRLKELTEVDDREDQELAQEAEDSREVVVRIAPDPWREKVVTVPGRRGRIVGAVEAGGRDAVVQLLEGWGLVWGTDILPPVDPIAGEDSAQTPAQPAPRQPHRRHQRWVSRDELDATLQITGITPRDYVRPERAARRAAGLPVSA